MAKLYMPVGVVHTGHISGAGNCGRMMENGPGGANKDSLPLLPLGLHSYPFSR